MSAHALLAAIGLIAAAPQPAQSPQRMFDAASALEAADDWAGALLAWQRLENASARNKRTRAVARLRKGIAAYQVGQPDQAVIALRAALAELPTGDATLRPDRQLAHQFLGRVAESSLDYVAAAREYAVVETLSDTPAEKLAVLASLAAVRTFTDPAAAAATLDRANALMATTTATKDTQALFARRRALLHLNRGDFTGATRHGKRAVMLLGGLTERVSLEDISARGDVALAMLLGGDPDKAREYLAYTGAGRTPKGFDPGVGMKPPACGGEAGLKPADVAVIEFSVGANGQVALATPIYAAGGPDVALAFARSAREWSWTPEALAKLPAFYRNRVRIEMRCTTQFERPSVNGFLEAELAAWLAAKASPLADKEGSPAALAIRQRAALASVPTDQVDAVPILYRLATNAVVSREESLGFARRALAIADRNAPPPSARLSLDLLVRRLEGAETWQGVRFRTRLRELASNPVYSADPRARAATRLLLADADSGDRARETLEVVANDTALAANDPLKVGALIRIASLEQADGDAEGARAAFARPGLAADQCALVDKAPRMVAANNSFTAFPQEALRWGFEGWVQTEHDIAADGRVSRARAILSYPPFVFSPAAEKMFKTARYEKTFRPDGGLGCGANLGRVRFILPGG